MLEDEISLIQRIRGILPKPSRRVGVGIGDDAAIVTPPHGRMVVTVDTLVENVHFDLHYMTPRELGRRSISVAVSDLAAMTAKPLYCLTSIGLRQEYNEFFVDELYEGIKESAIRYGVDIIGGNTVQSPLGLVIDVTAVGEGRRLVTRSGARPGDLLAVTGNLGESAAGLALLKRVSRGQIPKPLERLVRAHIEPTARVKEALAIGRYLHAAIDLSDGLATDLNHLCLSSAVGALILRSKLPISSEMGEAAVFVGTKEIKWALYGGEDYELLVAISPKEVSKCERALKKLKRSLFIIGEVQDRSKGVRIENERGEKVPLPPLGWNHFVRRKR